MSLGKKIVRLRNQNNMSQGDLADLLQVSRQSISKWENDLATPELDKLMKLSEIFQVSLDDLVYENKVITESVLQNEDKKMSKRTVAAIVHFILAGFVVLLFTLMNTFVAGFLFSIPFIVSGCCCLFFKKHTMLYTSWVLFILLDIYFKSATGIHWTNIFFTFIYEPSWNYIRLLFAWVVFILMVLLVFFTIQTFWKKQLVLDSKGILLLIGGWILYLCLRSSIMSKLYYYKVHYSHNMNLLYVLIQEIRFILFTINLTYTIRFIQTKRMNKSS